MKVSPKYRDTLLSKYKAAYEKVHAKPAPLIRYEFGWFRFKDQHNKGYRLATLEEMTARLTLDSGLGAQELCSEIFSAVEGALSDAWISDDAGTDSPQEYLEFVRGHLMALEEARITIRKFLRKYRKLV